MTVYFESALGVDEPDEPLEELDVPDEPPESPDEPDEPPESPDDFVPEVPEAAPSDFDAPEAGFADE